LKFFNRNPQSQSAIVADGWIQPPLFTAAKLLKDFFSEVSSPLTVSVRFNAGVIPADTGTDEESGAADHRELATPSTLPPI